MKNQIFVDNVNMETQTIFMKNGNISIYPCGFELGKTVVAGGGNAVSQKGRMITEQDGTSHFKHYRKDTGSRYRTLWTEAYGELKMSKTRLVLKISVPLGMNDPMGELAFEAELLKPRNTNGNVVREIEEAIDALKK